MRKLRHVTFDDRSSGVFLRAVPEEELFMLTIKGVKVFKGQRIRGRLADHTSFLGNVVNIPSRDALVIKSGRSTHKLLFVRSIRFVEVTE